MNLIPKFLRAWLSSKPQGESNRAPLATHSAAFDANEYAARIAQETSRFSAELDVNALPDIFHYWSNAYLRPMLEQFGYGHPEDFFAKCILAHANRHGLVPQVVSIGSGNCDAEVRIAQSLRNSGLEAFTIECLDLTQAMLDRGKELAARNGLADHFQFTCADFNRWRPARHYDVVMANQSLHHVVALEHLFDAVSEAIGERGIFVTSDMIGRNGHQRWPEALAILREFWRELPETHRFNLQLRRAEPEYLDWDCAGEGFEGVRAQDILPLLIERFGFEFFLAFGNVVSPFIDRAFGHHLHPDREWDRAFVDRIQARDQAEIEAGNIKPTQMLAILSNDRSHVPRVYKHLTPQFCVRKTD